MTIGAPNFAFLHLCFDGFFGLVVMDHLTDPPRLSSRDMIEVQNHRIVLSAVFARMLSEEVVYEDSQLILDSSISGFVSNRVPSVVLLHLLAVADFAQWLPTILAGFSTMKVI